MQLEAHSGLDLPNECGSVAVPMRIRIFSRAFMKLGQAQAMDILALLNSLSAKKSCVRDMFHMSPKEVQL